MTPNPFTKQYLMTAGPTPVPPAVSQAMAAPMLYHRAPAFDELYERVLGKLPAVFRTSNDVLAFAASGTGALESAVSNLVRPGDKILVGAAGKFGERWIQLGEAYGAEVVRYSPAGASGSIRPSTTACWPRTPTSRSRSPRSARRRPASCTTSRRSPRSPASTT
jgi:serine---pyruvate transaminase